MRSFLSYLTTRGERWQKVKEYQWVKCRRTLPADTCISAMTSRNMTHAKGGRDCAKIDALLAVKQGPCTDEGIGLGRSSIRQATLTLAPRMPALLLWRGRTDGSRHLVAMGYRHCESCRAWSARPVNAFILWPECAGVPARGRWDMALAATRRRLGVVSVRICCGS